MKKLVAVMVMIVLSQFNAYAFNAIDIDYTGRSYSDFADTTPFASNIENDPPYLGGYPARNSKEVNAYQFTVKQLATANYLSINALLTPNVFEHDAALSEYISQLRGQGATTDEIITAIPGFVSPSQNINVHFKLIKGSVPRPADLPTYTPLPSTNILSSASYNFYTDDGLHTKEYNNLLIPLSPFSSLLEPKHDYWIYATTPQLSNVRIDYSAGLVGTTHEQTVPEPATMLLMGGGLAGMLWRRRRVSKV